MFEVTEQGRQVAAENREQAEKAFRPYLSDGHAAESPSNPARSAGASVGRGEPVGHVYGTSATMTDHGVETAHMQCQALAPSAAAVLASVSGPDTALASAHTTHNGVAAVVSVDAAGAARTGLAEQIGAAAPSGLPWQAPFHTAPTGAVPPAPRGGGPAAMTQVGGRA